jgi:hypothetical protein
MNQGSHCENHERSFSKGRHPERSSAAFCAAKSKDLQFAPTTTTLRCPIHSALFAEWVGNNNARETRCTTTLPIQ